MEPPLSENQPHDLPVATENSIYENEPRSVLRDTGRGEVSVGEIEKMAPGEA